ncbi:MAG: hypothetical protein H6839_18035 [Planctomycetes bacterium]|nr:hypothetical protein [Planctomycetota bacterium]
MRRRRKSGGRGFELRLNGWAARAAGIGFIVLIAGALIGCVVYSGGDPVFYPDQPPERFKPTPLDKLDRIEGWVPSWGDEARIAAEASAAGFTDLLFFHGSVAESGEVSIEDPAGLAAGLKAAVGTRRWLTVTNHGGSLETPLGSGLGAHVESLLDAFAASGCDHLDLDYESMNRSQAEGLATLVERLEDRLPAGSRLSLTLQPVDSRLRPDQRDVYRRLLESPLVYTMRLMMYDYHWRGSLPGALYPMPAFNRLLQEWAEFAHKLTLCLPLYGYDWPRPEDTTLPRAEVVTLRDVGKLSAKPGFDAVWMREQAELAARYNSGGVTHYAALPSLRAITARATAGLDWGVPAVSFWHLGCASPADIPPACRRNAEPREAVGYDSGESWADWMDPFRHRVCDAITADGERSLEQIGEAHGVSRATMYRFNEHIAGDDLAGRTVYVPK